MEREYTDVEEYLINFYKKELEESRWTKKGDLSIKNIFRAIGLHDNIIALYDEERNRHWTSETAVIKVGDKHIAFETAYSSGDMSAEEKGWEWDEEIWFVEPHEETVTSWMPV